MNELIRVIRKNDYASLIDFGAENSVSDIIEDFVKSKKSPLTYMVKNDKEFNEFVLNSFRF
jgi:predicted CopG family antitoxin